ncbi:tetratricopeptide repeat protein [Vibrio agarivorans]|uniref:Tetratricopeptide repeat protein n=1 Tax=Vibrio agarivorans TaxID=153622 RepID=A0ABT7Y6X1_9VIBR|nr:tetratricopeptide repeat protein [Vibrio agarivorans]MDN2483808.1 tetratricopeptide repeat protein [Vibrio agarivorans]
MSFIGIAVGLAGVSLISMFLWMLSLSLRKKRMEQEKIERDRQYRRTLARAKEQEHQERVMKAECGHIPTILYLAKESERRNTREALYWYEKAAELDNIMGMQGVIKISQLHTEDLVLKEKAKFWKKCAKALNGDLTAKYETGVALIYGQGIAKDPDRGLEHVISAAELDYMDSILFLGQWYQSKDNPSPEPEKALFWNKAAAKLGDKRGMLSLGKNYLKGIGTEVDFLQGCYWLERAAEKGSPEAMCLAGEVWIDKKPSGNAIAYTWLFMAAHYGWQDARPLRDKVANNIGVDSVVGLQSLTKPLIRKISEGKVAKHSLIRAFNKLYKRKVPIPKKIPVVSEEAIVEGVTSDSNAPSGPVADTLSYEPEAQHSGQELNPQIATTSVEAQSVPAMDFSQTPMDSSFRQ